MTKRSKRMGLLVMLAHREEDECATEFQKQQQTEREQEEKLVELKEYYKSYKQQFSKQTQNVRVEDIINARGLLSRLAEAQDFQKQQIILAKNQTELAKKQWQEKRLKHQSLLDLQARCENEEQMEYDRQEQKSADEWSSIAFNHKNKS